MIKPLIALQSTNLRFSVPNFSATTKFCLLVIAFPATTTSGEHIVCTCISTIIAIATASLIIWDPYTNHFVSARTWRYSSIIRRISATWSIRSVTCEKIFSTWKAWLRSLTHLQKGDITDSIQQWAFYGINLNCYVKAMFFRIGLWFYGSPGEYKKELKKKI